jgi:hypothetical protein
MGWADAPGATERDQEDARIAIDFIRQLIDGNIIGTPDSLNVVQIKGKNQYILNEDQARLVRELRDA